MAWSSLASGSRHMTRALVTKCSRRPTKLQLNQCRRYAEGDGTGPGAAVSDKMAKYASMGVSGVKGFLGKPMQEHIANASKMKAEIGMILLAVPVTMYSCYYYWMQSAKQGTRKEAPSYLMDRLLTAQHPVNFQMVNNNTSMNSAPETEMESCQVETATMPPIVVDQQLPKIPCNEGDKESTTINIKDEKKDNETLLIPKNLTEKAAEEKKVEETTPTKRRRRHSKAAKNEDE